jgi:hypothetical protein
MKIPVSGSGSRSRSIPKCHGSGTLTGIVLNTQIENPEIKVY